MNGDLTRQATDTEAVTRSLSAPLLREAYAHHRAGRLAEAETLYRRILETDPRHPDAIHSLGLLHHLRGDQATAEEWIRRALTLDAGQAHYHNNLGLVLRARGQFPEAADCFARAVELRPDYALALKNLGLIRGEQGRPAEAAECLRQAARLGQTDAEAFFELGRTMHRQGKPEAAERAFRRAVELDPGRADAWNDLGVLLQEDDRRPEAVGCFRRAKAAKPEDVRTAYNLAVALCEQGEHAEAEAVASQALAADPHATGARLALGLVHYRRGEFEAAAGQLRAVLRQGAGSATAYNNLGSALRHLGRDDEALEMFEQALRLEPERSDVHLNRALLWLARGEFRRGWTEYEWRRAQKKKYPRLPRPLWDGSPLGGRRILLHAEQGLGDTLQFVRYAPLVRAMGGHVILACQRPLQRLLALGDVADELVLLGQSAGPSYDVQAPLLSLPGLLRTALDSVPADVPYLRADPRLVERWRPVVDGLGEFRVGISWQGSTTYIDDANRSVPLRHFRRLAEVPGVRLVSLQRGYGTEQIGGPGCDFPLHVFEGDFDDSHGAFMDTAAVMRNLDLVITSDTAVAHLAGALGVPVWVALGDVPDWRWLLGREDCPWYPTMRLFRQRRHGDWDGVFQDIAGALRADRLSANSGRGEAPAPERIDLRWSSPVGSDPTGEASSHSASRSAATRRVLALSFLHLGNFGDRLGFHLLGDVLPPHAEVTHACFQVRHNYRPLPPPVGEFDLVVLGIGHSVFTEMLTDDLFALLEGAKTVIGLFGTQYPESLDTERLARLLDRLDHWYARSAEDLRLYGAGRANASHLGDWLINAFPLARPTVDRLLYVGDETWQDRPLDRTIQRIQAHRRVHSTRLHPLLCALTSAEEVAYRDQREDGSGRPSGKFRSLLLDIFGREHPEDRYFRVDRAAVAAYKHAVRERTDRLRRDLEGFLS